MKTLKMSVLALLVITAACKKDEPAAVVASKSELISKSAWLAVSAEFDLDGDGTIDQNGTLDSCSVDDLSKFLSNGSFVIDPGTIKCDPTDSIETGTWKFHNNETKLVTYFTADGYDTVDIQVLNETTLKVKAFYDPAYIYLTYKH